MFVDGVEDEVFGKVDFAFKSFGGRALDGDVGFKVNGEVFSVAE